MTALLASAAGKVMVKLPAVEVLLPPKSKTATAGSPEAESLKIISALADGKNPENGDSLSANHILQSPSVIRAMFHALRSMEKT